MPLSSRPQGAASAFVLAVRAPSGTSPLLTPRGRARAAKASCPRSSGPAEPEEPPISSWISWSICETSVPSSPAFLTRSFRLSTNFPSPRWNSPISPQALSWCTSSCRPMSAIVRMNSSLTSSLPSSPFSSLSSFPALGDSGCSGAALFFSAPAMILRTSGNSVARESSSSRSSEFRLSSSRSMDEAFLSACCSSILPAAPTSSSTLACSHQLVISCTTASLHRATARHWEVTRCCFAKTFEKSGCQFAVAIVQVLPEWLAPSDCSSCMDSSTSPFSSKSFRRRFRSAFAFSTFFACCSSSALRSSSCFRVAFSLSSQVCFMNFSISSIWTWYLLVSATPEACSASFAFSSSTSSSSLAMCSASSFFVALTLMVFARLA
mmetsp:Transcript_107844/g.336338  ORF Transcript_107844/g.336338 Transcript_107844/m.336338 type:complete len:379 (+) Transcript_107844:638-1774(+)